MGIIKELTPRIYGKNLTWSLVPKNKIDTFTCQPAINQVVEEKLVASTTVSSINIDGVDTNLNSIDLSTPLQETAVTYNEHARIYEYRNYIMAKGVVGITYGTVTLNITTDTPVVGNPRLEVIFAGNTIKTNRGKEFVFDDAPAFDADFLEISTWINSNKDTSEEWSNNSSNVNYENEQIPLFPWVNTIIKSNNDDDFDSKHPNTENILTSWNVAPANVLQTVYETSFYSEWKTTDNFNVSMWPDSLRSMPWGSTYAGWQQKIKLKEKYFTQVKQIRKTDNSNYSFEISLKVPVKYVYYAMSRYGTTDTTHQAFIISQKTSDSNSFIDIINSITINVYGKTLDESNVKESYSLNSYGTLTTNTINKHPISIDRSELLTLDTSYDFAGYSVWSQSMAYKVLKAYQYGKFIVECKVKASWALSNNLGINALFKVKLLDGSYISRNHRVCTFEAKNITKEFEGSRFNYNIKLLQGETTLPYIENIDVAVHTINKTLTNCNVDDSYITLTSSYVEEPFGVYEQNKYCTEAFGITFAGSVGNNDAWKVPRLNKMSISNLPGSLIAVELKILNYVPGTSVATYIDPVKYLYAITEDGNLYAEDLSTDNYWQYNNEYDDDTAGRHITLLQIPTGKPFKIAIKNGSTSEYDAKLANGSKVAINIYNCYSTKGVTAKEVYEWLKEHNKLK